MDTAGDGPRRWRLDGGRCDGNEAMRLLIWLLQADRQVRWLFDRQGGRWRFHPAGASLPGLTVDRRQRRRIEQCMPAVYVRLTGIALAGNLAVIAGIVLWDRFVGYVDALAALAAFAATDAMLAIGLHGWLYLSLRRIIREATA